MCVDYLYAGSVYAGLEGLIKLMGQGVKVESVSQGDS